MSQLGLAIGIAAKAFQDRTDKGGEPYILHCLRVMNKVKYLGHDIMCIAILHDVIEDTHYDEKYLRDAGFSNYIIEGVNALTKNKDCEYETYIKRIATYSHLVPIKLADLEDNSNITRLKGISKKDLDRMEKYHKAYLYLSKL